MALHDDDLLLINDSQDSNEAKKIKFSTLKSNISGGGGTQNLQEVTDAGNTTTNGATFGGTVTLTATTSGRYLSLTNDACTNTGIEFGISGDANMNIWNTEDTYMRFANNGGEQMRLQDGNLMVGGTYPVQPNIPATPNITLTAAGAGNFVGIVTVDRPLPGAPFGPADQNALLIESGSTCNAKIAADGSVKIGGTLSSTTSSFVEQGNITLKSDGSAHFVGNVTSDGTIGFNLEADNPDNYTVTTSTDEEGNEVETRVYTGPTLDVKERVMNLISRLDALEANEVIDDAVDTSLLSLLASASARLDSIEARLAALEGGTN